VSDGIFDLTAETLGVIQAPDFTHVMLAAVAALASDIVDEKVGSEEAVTRYAAISPKLGEIARSALSIGKGALFYLSAGAAIYATVLQQQSVDLQKASNASSDHALELTLKALSDLKFLDNEQQHRERATSGGPTECESAAEPRSFKLKPHRKPKAREVRRKSDAARRQAFNPHR
jgi:hypothetical protein